MIKYIIWLFDHEKGCDRELDGRYYDTKEAAQTALKYMPGRFADSIKIKILEVITND